jgi:hypothetical protein
MDMLLFVHHKSSVLQTGNQNPKGWSMKQSLKTPFLEKEDGVFVC